MNSVHLHHKLVQYLTSLHLPLSQPEVKGFGNSTGLAYNALTVH